MRVTLYVHLDHHVVDIVSQVVPNEFGTMTGFSNLSEQDREKYGWHTVTAVVPDIDPLKQVAGDFEVTYSPKKGFLVKREVRTLSDDEIATNDLVFNTAQKQARAAAMVAEADPLFMKQQRGEASRGKWLAKVEEIRARYPYR